MNEFITRSSTCEYKAGCSVEPDHPVHNETLSNNYRNGQEPPNQPSTLLQPHVYLRPTLDLATKTYHGLTEDHIPLSNKGRVRQPRWVKDLRCVPGGERFRHSLFVTPQPALSCDVRDVGVSCVKSYQDFSLVMNKIVGAELNQI